MWLSKTLAKNNFSSRAERGNITISNNNSLEACASASARNISVYSPYGYCALPPVGEEIIVIPSLDGQVALGSRSKNGDIMSGEIKIQSLGGASILLKNDGSVVINDSFIIGREGDVTYEL